jgi:predicted site-specific integrase-resolvase
MTVKEDTQLLKPKQARELLNISKNTLQKFVECELLERVWLPNGHSRYRRGQVEGLLLKSREK